MKLTERLQVIADQVELGETVADIGTDHGYLPLYLYEKEISPHVIMTDVSEGSLDKARENCRELYPEAEFDLRLGDGIKVLGDNEAEVIVIAGMGGILISEILAEGIYAAKNAKRLVLQPRNHIGILRWWLENNGFSISRELLVREGKYIWEVIVASWAADDSCVGTKTGDSCGGTAAKIPEAYESAKDSYDYPESLAASGEKLAKEFFSRKLAKERFILSSMEGARLRNAGEELIQKKRVAWVERLCGIAEKQQ